jgi:hypothetical protein
MGLEMILRNRYQHQPARDSKHAAGRTRKRADKPREKRARKAAAKDRAVNRNKRT